MSYLNVAELAGSATFRQRLHAALVDGASKVLGEDKAAMAAAQIEKRNQLAMAIMADPATKVSAFVWPILANSTIAGAGLDAPDADLAFQIQQVWDMVAGVTDADKATDSSTAPTA